MVRLYTRTHAIEILHDLQCTRSAEPNIFNHPAFLCPALENFASADCGIIFDESPQHHFLMPFRIGRAGLGLKKTISSWSNIYATQTTPLVSAQFAPDILEGVLKALANHEYALPDTLLLPEVNLNAPFAQALSVVAKKLTLPLVVIREEQRPVLASCATPEQYLATTIGKNHNREYRRLWRRLSETGHLRYHIASNKNEILRAFEDYMQLEAAGWKGKQGTAFLSKSKDTDFARKAIYNLAKQDLVRIHILSVNDRPVASLVVFYYQNQAWTWKTAYDENLKAFSPGVLLMIEVLKNHIEDAHLRITDSCAIPDHPVMSRLFHERENFGTIVLGLTDRSLGSVTTITRQLNRYDWLRQRIRSFKLRLPRP